MGVELTEEDFRKMDETLCTILAEKAGVDKNLCLTLAKAVREGKMRPDEAIKRMGVRKEDFDSAFSETLKRVCGPCAGA